MMVVPVFFLYGAPLPPSLLDGEQEFDDLIGREEVAAVETFRDSVLSLQEAVQGRSQRTQLRGQRA